MAERIYPLSLEILTAFADEKWGERGCECCGHGDWAFGAEVPDQLCGLALPAEDGGFRGGAKNFGRFYFVICENCGNTRLISKMVLDNWLAAAKRTGGP